MRSVRNSSYVEQAAGWAGREGAAGRGAWEALLRSGSGDSRDGAGQQEWGWECLQLPCSCLCSTAAPAPSLMLGTRTFQNPHSSGAYKNPDSQAVTIPNKSGLWGSRQRVCVCAQSRLTLCNPMDYSPPGSSVHGILQAGILEWVAISFSRGSS